MSLKSKDCLEYLEKELKKELIGPSDGLFNRVQYKKVDGKDKNYEANDVASLSFFPNEANLNKQEILVNSPKYNYIAGVLYPKKTSYSEEINHDFKNEESVSFDDAKISDLSSDNKYEKERTSENNYDGNNSDNEDPIDLTNELKPSAMGISMCIEAPEILIISLKNVGQYYKLTNKEEIPIESKIVAFYISKFNDENKSSYKWISSNYSLNNSNQNTVEDFISNVFEIKKSTFKNNVDYFDKFFDQRAGWYQKKSSPSLDDIKKKYDNYKKEDLENEIIKCIKNINTKEINETYKYEGYFRKNLNHEIEIKKEDLITGNTKKFIDYDGNDLGLSIHITKRKSEKENQYYLTLHLVNDNETSDKEYVKDCFFQCGFEIKSKDGASIFKEYKEKNLKYMDDEEKSLHLLHRNNKSYAVGHGCAVSWDLNEGNCEKVYTEIFPSYEVKPIKAKIFDDLNLDMMKFSEDIDFATNEIKKLIDKYTVWLENEKLKTIDLDQEFKEVSDLNIKKAKDNLNRINQGLEILKTDKAIQDAFMFMNKAMAQQQFHYKLSTEKDFEYKNDLNKIDYSNELQKIGKGKWYPFQIIFIILNIKSFYDPLSEDRDIMDLIWFPTGGGKTEAYLGLSSFVIFLRKIKEPEKSGNAVIMRYTLRLLTTQQFLRASTLICACEKIRSENEEKLGKIEINIGLWIGGEATPNTEENAKKILSSLENPHSTLENKFLIINCPWCGEDMGPDAKTSKEGSIPGYKIENISPKEKKKIVFACENISCNFSHKKKNFLPIDVIDERIYEKQPDLVIGTIDKFATLPWKSEALECFASDENINGTDLIIQDELHLISGPLGSISGMYEICIKALTEKKINNQTITAKIVGSTATISKAEKQIYSLYGKKCSIFPSQTNQLEDSFFSYEKKDADGRKYVGIFCPSSTSPQITLSKVIASLFVNVKVFSLDKCNDPKIYDPYWTQLIYFNSIRELMTGASLLYDDVDGEKNALYVKKGLDFQIKKNYDYYRRINPRQIAELTSRQDSSEIPKILKRMFVSKNEDTYPYDICLATNMIQVGIDIPRLSLMIINGQPKTTSEYIQASSRVGRDQNSPGLVFNILSPFNSRDRSHYEHFKSYHQSIYNYVEPTSVTPHSTSVRKRCLHAVVITLCRLWDKKNRALPNLPKDEIKNKVLKYITDYVKKADPDHPEEVERTEKDILEIFRRWKEIQPLKFGSMSLDQSIEGTLMYPSGTEKKIEGDQFETPTSMRNVDRECSARITNTIGANHEI